MTEDDEKTRMLNAALEYWDRGWTVIPVIPESKRPAIKWQELQDNPPTYEMVEAWWTRWPHADIAVVTGTKTGLVIVDCDNPEALKAAEDAGMRSPIRVKTKRGDHLYFAHPRDGIRRGPRAGSNSRGADWPKIPGLDFRGDGSYALVPPSKGYRWDIAPSMDWDDLPVWRDWHPSIPEPQGEFSFETLDLSSARVLSPEDFMSVWDLTRQFVETNFPGTLRIPTGQSNGRNERVMRYVSECIAEGYWGDELRLKGYAFMGMFFVDKLPEHEFQATCRSVEEMHRRNHPEDFDSHGNFLRHPGPPTASTAVTRTETAPKPKRLIHMKDAEALLAKSEAATYLIEPWLPPQTIVQVYGYSGHGKSLFLQHAMAALASGRKYFGPFEVGRPGRVLYLDWENGMGTLARRLQELGSAHGDTGERLNIWTPFLDDRGMNLNTPEGLRVLQEWIEWARPDVVVIDTLRSAYPGLEENSAAEWAKIGQLATKIRNAGMAVVLVHHSNKPNEHGQGREAGSTAQLTTLETQIRVSQVFEDEATAKMKAGLFDEDYETPVFPLLRAKCPPGYRLYMVNEIRYGKVREWSDVHDLVQWVGYAAHDETEAKMVVSSLSTKQRAKEMALNGYSPETIASVLQRPLRMIKTWLEIA